MSIQGPRRDRAMGIQGPRRDRAMGIQGPRRDRAIADTKGGGLEPRERRRQMRTMGKTETRVALVMICRRGTPAPVLCMLCGMQQCRDGV